MTNEHSIVELAPKAQTLGWNWAPEEFELSQELHDEAAHALQFHYAFQFANVPTNGHFRSGIAPIIAADYPESWLAITPGAGAKFVTDVAPLDTPMKGTEGDITTAVEHRPFFAIFQAFLAFSLWFVFRIQENTALAGLESIWPGQTDLMVQEDCKDHRHEWWRWLTYQFTHVGLFHITTNTIIVLGLGILLEKFHGTLRMAFIFNVGVLGGACCYFAANNHARVVGMSGGCYALLGMQFGDLLMNFYEKKEFACKLLPFLVLICVVDTMQAFLFQNSAISFSAHFGGYIAGLLACIVMGRNLVLHTCNRYMKAIASVVGLGLVIFCLHWGMSLPPQNVFEQVRWCWARQMINRTLFGDENPHCVRCDSLDCIKKWSTQTNIHKVSASQCANFGGWAVTER